MDEFADGGHTGTNLTVRERSARFRALATQILAGYVTQVSPPGADGGVDILVGSGPMTFTSTINSVFSTRRN